MGAATPLRTMDSDIVVLASTDLKSKRKQTHTTGHAGTNKLTHKHMCIYIDIYIYRYIYRYRYRHIYI